MIQLRKLFKDQHLRFIHESRSRQISKTAGLLLLQVLLTCLVVGQFSSAILLAEADHDTPQGNTNPQNRPGGKKGGKAVEQGDGCRVGGGDLASIANGENGNIQPVVAFLTSPPCVLNSKTIAQEAINEGVQFNSVPFRLDMFAKNYSRLTVEGSEKIDKSLFQLVPPIMREHPMTAQEQLPLIAQFSILSRSTGLWALGNLVKQELIAGAPLLNNSNVKEGVAAELAKSLIKMGANETAIASQLADSIEEMALASQADSLGRVLKALATAASIDGSLVPTFNQVANAFNQGIQKGKKDFSNDNSRALAGASLEGAKAAIGGARTMEVGISDINEAFGALLSGKTVQSVGLKKMWKEIVKALAVSPLLPNLADAIAESLTIQSVYLEKRERGMMIAAAKNYPQIALAMEKNFLEAWNYSWDGLHDGGISPKEFNVRKKLYFEPTVAELLELDAGSVDAEWLKEVVKRGLVTDDDIEKKFPRFVLSLIDKREKMASATDRANLEPTVSMMAENFGILWTLSNVHVPALRKWVSKYDE